MLISMTNLALICLNLDQPKKVETDESEYVHCESKSVGANWAARPDWQAKLIRVSNPTVKGAQYNDQ